MEYNKKGKKILSNVKCLRDFISRNHIFGGWKNAKQLRIKTWKCKVSVQTSPEKKKKKRLSGQFTAIVVMVTSAVEHIWCKTRLDCRRFVPWAGVVYLPSLSCCHRKRSLFRSFLFFILSGEESKWSEITILTKKHTSLTIHYFLLLPWKRNWAKFDIFWTII